MHLHVAITIVTTVHFCQKVYLGGSVMSEIQLSAISTGEKQQ
jgi:hypothetical protein